MKESVTDRLVVKLARTILAEEIALSESNYNDARDAFLKIKAEMEKTKDELAIYERRYKLAINFKDYLMWDNERLREEKLEISEELKELQGRIQKDSQDKLKLAAVKAVKHDKLIACFAAFTALITVLSAASYYFPTLPEEILAPVIIKECPKHIAGFYETWRGYGS